MKKLLLGLGLIITIALLIFTYWQYNNAVETCVANGQDRQVCESGLR